MAQLRNLLILVVDSVSNKLIFEKDYLLLFLL